MNARSSNPVTDTDSSRESTGYGQRLGIKPLSMTYREGSSAQYAGLIPQDADIYAPSLTSPALLQNEQLQEIKKKEAEIKKLQSELDKIRGIQTQINERLEFAPP